MTNLILALIGIILAAGAALITINYGGDYFVESADSGEAGTMESAMTNVLSSYRLFEMRGLDTPANLDALITDGAADESLGAMLDERPLFSGNGTFNNEWSNLTIEGIQRSAVTIEGLDDEVCASMTERNGGPSDGTIPDAPITSMGCFASNGNNIAYLAL